MEGIAASVKAAFRETGAAGSAAKTNELLQIFSLMVSTVLRNLKGKNNLRTEHMAVGHQKSAAHTNICYTFLFKWVSVVHEIQCVHF